MKRQEPKHRKYHHETPWTIGVNKNGRVQLFPRLWVNGEYRRDPAILFDAEERSRIANSIRTIKSKITVEQ